MNPAPRAAPLRRTPWLLLSATLVACLAFAALGTWQVQRLFWKHALIDRVARRIHAAPVPAPLRPNWSHVSADQDAYRRVTVHGVYLAQAPTPVQALTEYGAGWWLLAPLRRADDGSIVVVNRGFVAAPPVPLNPPGAGPAGSGNPGSDVTVTGLLRMSEPGGGFLRKNDALAGRWYSRDVAAIAAARGLRDVAPYFIDADATANDADPAHPRGGLTVVHFPDNHLTYAATWYTLALMAALAAFWLARGSPTRAAGQDDE